MDASLWNNERALQVMKELNFPHLTGTPDLERARDLLVEDFKGAGGTPTHETFHYSNTYRVLLHLMTLLQVLLGVGKAVFWTSMVGIALACAIGQTFLLVFALTRALFITRWLYTGRGSRVGHNIVTDIPASQEEHGILVIGAHYDTIAVSPVRMKLFMMRLGAFVLTTLFILSFGVLRLFIGQSPLWATLIVWIGTLVEIGSTIGMQAFRKQNRSPGSNDNSSGVAALVELAHIFAAAPLEHLSLQLVAFDAEEVGLVGSTAFVHTHTRDLGTRHARMLSLDMVAGKLPIRVVTRSSVPPAHHGDSLFPVIKTAAARGPGEEIQVKDAWFPYFGSDHGPFHIAGIPSAWIFTPSKGANTWNDTWDKVQPETLARAGTLLVSFVRELNRQLGEGQH